MEGADVLDFGWPDVGCCGEGAEQACPWHPEEFWANIFPLTGSDECAPLGCEEAAFFSLVLDLIMLPKGATFEDAVGGVFAVAIEVESGRVESDGDGVKADDSACALCGIKLQTAVVAVEVVFVLIETVAAIEEKLWEVFEACADLQVLFRLKTSVLLTGAAVAGCTGADVAVDAEEGWTTTGAAVVLQTWVTVVPLSDFCSFFKRRDAKLKNSLGNETGSWARAKALDMSEDIAGRFPRIKWLEKRCISWYVKG